MTCTICIQSSSNQLQFLLADISSEIGLWSLLDFRCCNVDKKMGICSISARFMMIVLSVIFWAFSAGCLFVAIELFRFMGPLKGEILDKLVLLAPGCIMVVLTILLFIVGMIGLCGACKENKCLKGTFCVMLLLVIGIEVAGVVCGVVYKDEVKGDLQKSMKSALDKYDESGQVADAVDTLQRTFECCGVSSYKDWYSTPWGKKHINLVPESCCKKGEKDKCTGSTSSSAVDLINTEGCHLKLYEDIQHYLVLIIAVAIVFALIQILGLGCTCSLLCTKKSEVPYQSLSNEAGGYRA